MSRGLTEAAARARTGRAVVFLAAATVAWVDLTAKAVSEARLADSPVDLGLIQLQLAYNSGVAFSMGDMLPTRLIVVATAAISLTFVVYAWYRAPRAGRIERVAGGAVIGGAVANVIDRARDGVVTDYLHTGWWPTFNLADTFLVIGCTAIALLHARSSERDRNPQNRCTATPPADGAPNRDTHSTTAESPR